MVTSDIRPEVERWPFHACAMENMPNHQNCYVLQEIGVKEHDSDVKFQTRSGNMAVSCMHNENYAIYCLLIDKWPKSPHPIAFLLTAYCDLIVDLAVE